jgi:hypothetical protein
MQRLYLGFPSRVDISRPLLVVLVVLVLVLFGCDRAGGCQFGAGCRQLFFADEVLDGTEQDKKVLSRARG